MLCRPYIDTNKDWFVVLIVREQPVEDPREAIPAFCSTVEPADPPEGGQG